MSAFVPGAGSSGSDRGEVALAQARQEAATLRGVLDAIAEALAAAMARLEALEAQVAVDGVPTEVDGDLPPGAPPAAPGHATPRTAGWKLPDWTPPAGDVVSGETLRVRREALGISQAAVAHAAHCSRGLVAEIERGKRRSAQTLAHLAKVLDRLEEQARRN